MDHSALNAPYNADAANPYAAGAGAGAGDLYNDLPVLQRRIMQYIVKAVADGEEQGVNVNAIERNAGQGATLNKVKADLETLISDGHLYQTIDDDQ